VKNPRKQEHWKTCGAWAQNLTPKPSGISTTQLNNIYASGGKKEASLPAVQHAAGIGCISIFSFCQQPGRARSNISASFDSQRQPSCD
jgi:hypothetical protein